MPSPLARAFFRLEAVIGGLFQVALDIVVQGVGGIDGRGRWQRGQAAGAQEVVEGGPILRRAIASGTVSNSSSTHLRPGERREWGVGAGFGGEVAAKAGTVAHLREFRRTSRKKRRLAHGRSCPAAAGVADPASKLERALEWIEELEERFDASKAATWTEADT
ncbi:hypothetical protein SFUMM280S_08956 [Streptomyces fumanus]